MIKTRMLATVMKMFVLILFSLYASNAVCQKAATTKIDSANLYYLNYDFTIIPRIYIADKVNNLKINSFDGKSYFHYRPNVNYRLGFGVTYRAVTLDLDFAAGSTNPAKGRTGSLDFQSNIYTKEWAVDLLLQSYKGYYVSTPANIIGDGPYYFNPDMRITFLGSGAWRILNSDEFSYQAAMTQSEWQLKSAGSILVGGEAYYGKINANGQLIPEVVKDSFPQRGIEQLRFFKIGPGIGYAYTYVYEKNYFASAGLTTVFEAGFVKESSASVSANKFSFQPDVTFRLGIGYNSDNWAASLAGVLNNIPIRGTLSSGDYSFHTGNLRLTLARRFVPNAHTKKMLRHVDDTLDRLQ